MQVTNKDKSWQTEAEDIANIPVGGVMFIGLLDKNSVVLS